MKIASFLLPLSLICYAGISSCQRHQPIASVFAGSTPCNAWVNAILFIRPTDTCAFMKWELNLFDNGKDSSFSLQVSYGDYLPNTPNFAGGGKALSVKGSVYTIMTRRNNTPYRILELNSKELNDRLRFLVLDSNILHFIYPTGDLVKGDESHGFILNKINTP